MRMYDILSKKRDGKELSVEEIRWFIRGYVCGDIPDYQASALCMAICIRGMNPREITDLTLAMAESGDQVDLSPIHGIKVDKHSTGGVGDKTTLIIAPIVASLGVHVAKMSGRGLGHTGGTLDKLESIPGFRIDLSREEFFRTVNTAGFSVIGQSGNLVPADKKLYALRDVTGTVESIPLIASSIMSKKLAAGSNCILLDVKTGSGAFMKTKEDSLALAETMVKIGENAGKRTVALITNMDRPLGRKIGNALEVMEACETLHGNGPEDLREICLAISANMLFLAGKGSLKECRKMAEKQIENGQAFDALCKMVEAQGGDSSFLKNPEKFSKPKAFLKVCAPQSGYLSKIQTEQVGEACVELGAGREKKEDSIDYSAGITLCKTVGEAVKQGETLAILSAETMEKCHTAETLFRKAVTIGAEKPFPQPMVLARISKDEIEKFSHKRSL